MASLIFNVSFLCLSCRGIFFKKVSDKNITPEETGNLTLSDGKDIALKEAMLHSKIMLGDGVLSIPGVCKVNVRSDLPKKRGQSDIDSIHYVKKIQEMMGNIKRYKIAKLILSLELRHSLMARVNVTSYTTLP